MHLDQHVSLKAHHTFGMEVEARYFVEAKTHSEVLTLLNYRHMIHMPILFLGSGSNILFTSNFAGIVIKINSKGIEIREEDDNHVVVTAEAGENWDDFVQHCVERGWAGLENLSLIPGKVGAAPIQNIGAYGVEVKEVIESVQVADIETGKQKRFTNADCRFGYRDSIFKRELKGKVIILNVTFKLTKVTGLLGDKVTGLQGDRVGGLSGLKLDYGEIRAELQKMGVTDPAINDVREAVCNIRRRKLPDPDIAGNAGSFFKNPVIGKELWRSLLEQFPGMPSYPQSPEQIILQVNDTSANDDVIPDQIQTIDKSSVPGESKPSGQSSLTNQSAGGGPSMASYDVKIPAAWLIEQCGWKGYRNGDAGVHPGQPLVLVNYGTATGRQILDIATQIRDSVYQKFGITLETEVNIID
jgi:UDP-N-acetylmuramate dehydrogenase